MVVGIVKIKIKAHDIESRLFVYLRSSSILLESITDNRQERYITTTCLFPAGKC